MKDELAKIIWLLRIIMCLVACIVGMMIGEEAGKVLAIALQ